MIELIKYIAIYVTFFLGSIVLVYIYSLLLVGVVRYTVRNIKQFWNCYIRPRFAIVRNSWGGEWDNFGLFNTEKEAEEKLNALRAEPREDCRMFLLISREDKQFLIKANFYNSIPAEVKKFLKW